MGERGGWVGGEVWCGEGERCHAFRSTVNYYIVCQQSGHMASKPYVLQGEAATYLVAVIDVWEQLHICTTLLESKLYHSISEIDTPGNSC